MDSVLWQWLKLGYVKKEHRSNGYCCSRSGTENEFDKKQAKLIAPPSPFLCRVYQSVDELSMHIVSECKLLAKQHYMIRPNLIATHVHWELCWKFEIKGLKKTRMNMFHATHSDSQELKYFGKKRLIPTQK